MAKRKPRCIVIAGPDGAGKTTFAKEFLPNEAGVLHFVNADLIAAGLSPLDPPAAQVAAARILLNELDRLAGARDDFAFETTMSGLAYIGRLRRWKASGYRIELLFLKLPSIGMALDRIVQRVRQGGHHVPAVDVRRRFKRVGLISKPHTRARSIHGRCTTTKAGSRNSLINPMAEKHLVPKTEFSKSVERALKRAYRAACKTARMHGTLVVEWIDGKVVLVKP